MSLRTGLFDVLVGLFMIGMGLVLLIPWGISGLAAAAGILFGVPSIPFDSPLDRLVTFLWGLLLFGISALSLWRGVRLLAVGDAQPETTAETAARPKFIYRLGRACGRLIRRLSQRTGQ